MDTDHLLTEQRNPLTEEIDTLSTLEMVHVINHEDGRVASAVAETLPEVAMAIDEISARMRQGGRLIYVGAGTSGRLGILDASECPPTFNAPLGLVVGVIAGGAKAITSSVEAAEDDPNQGAADLEVLRLTALDSVVGLAASGRTPYVVGALEYARQIGSFTVSVACSHPSPMAEIAQVAIAALVGPEVVTGSTRLKAGTAQKMILNMLSTGVMIRLGKTYGNLMVDVQPTNVKLRQRARRIVAQACDLGLEAAEAKLAVCDGEVKTAIVATKLDIAPEEARQRLTTSQGIVRLALGGSRFDC
jgi:N-acetylmuramic acid 6-phosphate etherase